MGGTLFQQCGALWTLQPLSQELSIPHTLCCLYKQRESSEVWFSLRWEEETIVKLNHYWVK